MISKVTLTWFKQFKDPTEFTFHSQGVTFLAGGNNSGKSSLLQGLTLWEFAKTTLEVRKGAAALLGGGNGSAVGVGYDEFTPLAVPNFRHLWSNLQYAPANAYKLKVRVTWTDAASASDRHLEFAFSLQSDRLMLKRSNATLHPGERIPRIASLPPFAGIGPHEERLSRVAQRRLVGRGLAGAILRNVLLEQRERHQRALDAAKTPSGRIPNAERARIRRDEPWEQLALVLGEVFEMGVDVGKYDDAHDSRIDAKCWDGEMRNKALRRKRNVAEMDLLAQGSGFLQWLSVYALAVDPAFDVLLLDEPDAHLHPALQGHLIDKLREVAVDKGKQVLLATHSTVILGEAKLDQVYRMENRAYLSDEKDRTGLFVGLGSQYAPRLDQLKRHRRLFMYDGPTDLEVLKAWAATLNLTWPNNLVCWKYTKDRLAREVLFDELRAEIPGLKGLSLQDRDDFKFADSKADLTFENIPKFQKGLGYRRWRRRNLENHLLSPPAIARAAAPEFGNVSEADVQTVLGLHGLAIPPNYTASDCPQTLANTDGKEVITKADWCITAAFGCTYLDIAEAMRPEEIPDDAKTFLNELVAFCAP